MTENLPVVRPAEPGREITSADTDSWIGVASDVIRLANLIAPTEFVPSALRDSAPATAAAILYGREVGLPPMTALTQTHVIDGKPAMSAEAMRALVLSAGHEFEVVETSRARCEVRGRRHGREKWTTVAVSIDEFTHLTSNPKKPNWKLYPRQMLQARATAELCRLAFPDVIHGFRAVEELDEYDETERTPSAGEPTGTTTVRRATKKTTAKKSTAAPIEQRERPAELTGPPLPGEAGYEDATAKDRTEDDAGADDSALPVRGDTGVTDEPPGGEGEGEAPEPPGGSEDRGPRKASRSQHRMIFALLDPLDVATDEDRYDIATAIVGRRVESFNALTTSEAKTIIDTLGRVKDRDELDAILAAAAGGES